MILSCAYLLVLRLRFYRSSIFNLLVLLDDSFVSPGAGRIVALQDVPDDTFAQKMLGDGFAIDLSDGLIVAPFSGKLETVFPTGHTFGIQGAMGEVLIHIDIDTVSFNGEGFDVVVKQGDTLVHVDVKKIKELGKSTLTMVLFTDGREIQVPSMNKEVKAGSELAIVMK